MKRFALTIFMAMVLLTTECFGQNPSYLPAFLSAYPDLGILSSTFDSKGNTYVTGFFSDSIQFANKKIYSRGSMDIFLTKFSPSHEVEWVKHAGGASMDLCQYVNADTNDNIYISGLFRGKLVFEDTAIFSKGKTRYFTAKYSDEGNLLWIKQNSKIK
jgi:hypothetical protein